MVEVFTAVPSETRLVLNVVDESRYSDWLASENLDEPIPTVSKIFVMYAKGPGCPVPVQIEIDQIETDYIAACPTEEDEKTLTMNQIADKYRRANLLLRRNLLLATVKGLDIDSANAMCADGAGGREILVSRGWLAEQPTQAETESDSENKEEGEDVTGESK